MAVAESSGRGQDASRCPATHHSVLAELVPPCHLTGIRWVGRSAIPECEAVSFQAPSVSQSKHHESSLHVTIQRSLPDASSVAKDQRATTNVQDGRSHAIPDDAFPSTSNQLNTTFGRTSRLQTLPSRQVESDIITLILFGIPGSHDLGTAR